MPEAGKYGVGVWVKLCVRQDCCCIGVQVSGQPQQSKVIAFLFIAIPFWVDEGLLCSDYLPERELHTGVSM